MMKIFIFSDSHGSLGEMIDLIGQHSPDMVLHLGDCSSDAEDLASIFPDLPLYFVPGNCDGFTQYAPIQALTIGEVKLLFSHGHHWYVKRDYQQALLAGREQQANIVLFGHTHRALVEEQADGLWLVNPGASPETYAVIHIQDSGEFTCETFSSHGT